LNTYKDQGELETLAERAFILPTLNLIWIMPAEGGRLRCTQAAYLYSGSGFSVFLTLTFGVSEMILVREGKLY